MYSVYAAHNQVLYSKPNIHRDKVMTVVRGIIIQFLDCHGYNYVHELFCNLVSKQVDKLVVN